MHRWNRMTGWQSTYKIRLQESNDGGDEMNGIVSANSNNIFLELSNNMIPLRRLLFNPRSGERFLSTHYLSSVWYPSSWAINGFVVIKSSKHRFFISKNSINTATNIFPPPTGAHGRYSNITINQAAVVILVLSWSGRSLREVFLLTLQFKTFYLYLFSGALGTTDLKPTRGGILT